jgi:hypothetical protein
MDATPTPTLPDVEATDIVATSTGAPAMIHHGYGRVRKVVVPWRGQSKKQLTPE